MIWWKNAIFYELYVDKFAGNFAGLSEKIPYLAGLGVNAVHVLPHYPSPMADEGYDVSDYRNVRPGLGTLDDFKRFLKTAESAGIKVMIDLVLNHTSVEHPWFKKAVSVPGSKEHDYYLWSTGGLELKDATNAFPHGKTGNWIFEKNTGKYYFSTFYPQQADLNWDNPEVFKEIVSIMDFWVSLGIGVFRFDAISHLAFHRKPPSVSSGMEYVPASPSPC